MDTDDLTETTARTILSDSNDCPPAHDTSKSSLPTIAPLGLDISDVCQFVFSSRGLDRFKPASFVPTETVFGRTSCQQSNPTLATSPQSTFPTLAT